MAGEIIDQNTGEVRPAPQSILEFLAAMDAGAFVSFASDEFDALKRAMQDHLRDVGGKHAKGRITITVDLKLDEIGTVEVFPEVSLKLPKPVAQRRIMFVGDKGHFIKQNPNQPELALRFVGGDSDRQTRVVG